MPTKRAAVCLRNGWLLCVEADEADYDFQLRALTTALLEKRPEWRDRHEGIILLNDNAPTRRTNATTGVLAGLG